MNTNEVKDIADYIQEAGLTKTLLNECRSVRKTTSYETIRNAFAKGPTTPARQLVIRIAKKIQFENYSKSVTPLPMEV